MSNDVGMNQRPNNIEPTVRKRGANLMEDRLWEACVRLDWTGKKAGGLGGIWKKRRASSHGRARKERTSKGRMASEGLSTIRCLHVDRPNVQDYGYITQRISVAGVR